MANDQGFANDPKKASQAGKKAASTKAVASI
jgi:hypothetical protein